MLLHPVFGLDTDTIFFYNDKGTIIKGSVKKVIIRFHPDLDNFLPHNRRSEAFEYQFKGNPTVKHLIESHRIPHTEVDKIIINGISEGFSYLIKDGDYINVYPYSMRPSEISHELTHQVERPRFLLDNHLGKLATYLRILGFDTLYRNDFQDEELVYIMSQDDRILLTRDRGLLMRRVVKNGYCIRSMVPKQQIIEVAQRFRLVELMQPFSRCLHCNCELEEVEKINVLDRLEPLTKKYYNHFNICPSCDRLFWKGSHHKHMLKFIDLLKTNVL